MTSTGQKELEIHTCRRIYLGLSVSMSVFMSVCVCVCVCVCVLVCELSDNHLYIVYACVFVAW